MCIILVKEKGQKFPVDYVLEMKAMGNRDGVGLMYVEDGRVKVHRILSPTDKELADLYEAHMDKDLVLHVRRQSIGKITEENVHPFQILSMEEDGRDLWMCHNGTIEGIQVDPGRADSYNLATYFLRPYLKKYPDAIIEPEFLNIVGGLIKNSKLVFLDNLGRFVVVNHELGQTHTLGPWLSTKSVVVPPKKTKTTSFIKGSSSSHKSNNSNNGGSSNVLSLPPHSSSAKDVINSQKTTKPDNPKPGSSRPVLVPDQDGCLHFNYEVPTTNQDWQLPLALQGKGPDEIKAMIEGDPKLKELVQDFYPNLIG